MSEENGIGGAERKVEVFRYCEESGTCKDIIQDAEVSIQSLVKITNKLIRDKMEMIANKADFEFSDNEKTRYIKQQKLYYYKLSEERLEELQLSRLENQRLIKKNKELLETISKLEERLMT